MSDYKQRKDKAEGLLTSYRDRVLTTANNTLCHRDGVLPYALALQTKDEVTGSLGEVGAGICSLLLDIDEPTTVELFKRASVAMQFGFGKTYKAHREFTCFDLR